MIIVSWNCAGAFRNKFTYLQNLLPDVCVVQECEDPTRSASDSYRRWSENSLWIGNNKNRGLGIFAKPYIHLEPVVLNDDGLETFLPCRIEGAMTLLRVWTRRRESYDYRYIGQLWRYLNLHAEALRSEISIVMGDFNSNVIWDKRHAEVSHTSVVQQLSNIGLESLYHYAQSVPQGKERDATLFLQRNLKKPYHIDYAFIPKNLLTSSTIEIGESQTWLKYSDHMPVRVKIGTVL
ncbi:MAG: endonuclease/exonuclease/phosphatase family protein [Nitrospira sp.]|nr:endonuclease/exonuclease/phosphatase family protein [Nitrospira sp.]MDR4464799.1 endonuclease/exonuclease/phosphatase family protein [Nitrospira sp.]